MANGNLPDVPASWNEMAKIVLQIVTLVAAVGSAAISSCNNVKVQQVQEHQAANAVKLDEVKADASAAKTEASEVKRVATNQAAEVKDKLEKIEKKSDAIKSALPPK